MSDDVDTRLLRAFVLTAAEGNLSRAAEVLAITQQGLSRQIQRLESLARQPLFLRTSSGVSLTKAGESFLRDAEAVLAATDRLFGGLKAGKEPLRLADIRHRRMMQDLWDAHKARNPGLGATFRDLTGGQQIVAVRTGALDVAMSWPLEHEAALSRRLIRLDRVVVFHVGQADSYQLGTDTISYAPVAEESRGWERFCEQLEVSLGIKLVRLPYDMTMLGAIATAQSRDGAPPMLALRGMLDYPDARHFRVAELKGVQPYYPWHLNWRADERRQSVLGFLSSAFEYAASVGWLDTVTDRDDIWLPRPVMDRDR